MAPAKLKIQRIENNRKRQSTLRKRRATLLEKAKELATLCDVAVAVVVYSQGEAAVPVTWPSPEETKEILERYVALPDFAKAQMNVESFMRERVEKVVRTLNGLKLGNRNRQVDIHLNEISRGTRHSLDDLIPELAEAVKSAYLARIDLIARCIKLPVSQAAAAAAAASAGLVPMSQIVSPSLEPAPVVCPPHETAPEAADALAPALLPMEPDEEPSHGSFLMEMVEAIMDDGSGRTVVPTDADLQRILMEHVQFMSQ